MSCSAALLPYYSARNTPPLKEKAVALSEEELFQKLRASILAHDPHAPVDEIIMGLREIRKTVTALNATLARACKELLQVDVPTYKRVYATIAEQTNAPKDDFASKVLETANRVRQELINLAMETELAPIVEKVLAKQQKDVDEATASAYQRFGISPGGKKH